MDKLTLAAESKAAWNAGDLKAASRAFNSLCSAFPEETFRQLGDGTIGVRTGVNPKNGEGVYEALT